MTLGIYYSLDFGTGLEWVPMVGLCCGINERLYSWRDKNILTGAPTNMISSNACDEYQRVPAIQYVNNVTGELSFRFPEDEEFMQFLRSEPYQKNNYVIPSLSVQEAKKLGPDQVLLFDFKHFNALVIDQNDVRKIVRLRIPDLRQYHKTKHEEQLFEEFITYYHNINQAL